MIPNFSTFISESLSIENSHYLDRVDQRISNLRLLTIISDSGEKIRVPNELLKDIEVFFRRVISNLTTPSTSKIFKELTIDSNSFGLIRVCKPKIILPDGVSAFPIFQVYERDDDTDKEVLRNGTYFWISTIGSVAKTIKLFNDSGESSKSIDKLIEISANHFINKRQDELARLEKVIGIDRKSVESIANNHTVILDPPGISNITLNLKSPLSIEEQAEKYISAFSKKERSAHISIDKEVDVTGVIKTMSIIPGKTWIVEWNDKFSTWGALPILDSKLIKGAKDNQIQVKVGYKWVHWLPEPRFNPPIPSNIRTIKLEDTISLSKKTTNGSWVINTGKIENISINKSTSTYPYIGVDEWDETESIPKKEAKNIFKLPSTITESFIPNFINWIKTYL